jgi:hypothetical protein
MKLPQDLQPRFIHPTLIVACDHAFAKAFLAGGDDLEELDGIAEPREKSTDSEGYFMSMDKSRHGNPGADKNDAPRLKRFTKDVANLIVTNVRDHGIVHIHLVMPTDVDTLVQDALPNDVKKKIVHVRNLDLMKEDPLTILRRAYE